MKKQIMNLLLLAAVSLIISGCANTGAFTATLRTNVELSNPNYQIVDVNISGTSKSGYVVGFSGSMAGEAGAFALFRVAGSGNLYQEALENLWKNYEEKNGSIKGKKLALINVRYDADMLNLLLYTQLRVTVRADVVEFI